MNSDYKDKHPHKSEGIFQSFHYAINGIRSAVTNERNLKIHLAAAFLVVLLGALFRLNSIEWLFIVFAIGGMVALELINTAIEKLVDLITSEYHPIAKQAKDISAGAVFVYAIVCVIAGIIIFLPKILGLFFSVEL